MFKSCRSHWNKTGNLKQPLVVLKLINITVSVAMEEAIYPFLHSLTQWPQKRFSEKLKSRSPKVTKKWNKIKIHNFQFFNIQGHLLQEVFKCSSFATF